MQHIPYIPKYTSNQPFKNDFTQSFSLAFIIRKNALILYSFSEEKEVQNGLFYHFIYKTLVVNWSNMLHRKFSAFLFSNLAHRNSYSYLHRRSNTPPNISISLLEIPNRVANSLHPFTTSITSEIIFSAVF